MNTTSYQITHPFYSWADVRRILPKNKELFFMQLQKEDPNALAKELLRTVIAADNLEELLVFERQGLSLLTVFNYLSPQYKQDTKNKKNEFTLLSYSVDCRASRILKHLSLLYSPESNYEQLLICGQNRFFSGVKTLLEAPGVIDIFNQQSVSTLPELLIYFPDNETPEIVQLLKAQGLKGEVFSFPTAPSPSTSTLIKPRQHSVFQSLAWMWSQAVLLDEDYYEQPQRLSAYPVFQTVLEAYPDFISQFLTQAQLYLEKINPILFSEPSLTQRVFQDLVSDLQILRDKLLLSTHISETQTTQPTFSHKI